MSTSKPIAILVQYACWRRRQRLDDLRGIIIDAPANLLGA
jgi:hypothetical protein